MNLEIILLIAVIAIIFAITVSITKEACLKHRQNDEIARNIRKKGEDLGLDFVNIDRLHRRLEKSLERKRRKENDYKIRSPKIIDRR